MSKINMDLNKIEWVENNPLRGRSIGIDKDSVTLAYRAYNKSNPNEITIMIKIGLAVMNECKFIPGRLVCLSYDKKNPRIMKLCSSKVGHTLSKITRNGYCMLQAKWRAYKPSEQEFPSRKVEIIQANSNGLIIKDIDFLK